MLSPIFLLHHFNVYTGPGSKMCFSLFQTIHERLFWWLKKCAYLTQVSGILRGVFSIRHACRYATAVVHGSLVSNSLLLRHIFRKGIGSIWQKRNIGYNGLANIYYLLKL
jgi:hypothetical protein